MCVGQISVGRRIGVMYLLKAYFDQIDTPVTSRELRGFLEVNGLSCTSLRLYVLMNSLCAQKVCTRLSRGKYQTVLD